jgi:hypothetical protein
MISVVRAISSGAQNVTLQEYFSYQSSVIYLFSNPAHKTKTGTGNRWQTTNSKPPGQIIKIGQNREGAAII